MEEKKTKKNNDLNVFTYGFYSWKYCRNWFRNIVTFFKNFRLVWQRATKGYCDNDIWCLDVYIKRLLRDTISELAQTHMGYPGDGTPEGSTDEAWTDYLNELSILFDKSIDRECESFQYYPNKYEEAYRAELDKIKFIKAEDGNTIMDSSSMDDVISKNYTKEALKIKNKRTKDFNTALDMLKNRIDDLWD